MSQWISVCVIVMHPMVLSALQKALDSDSVQTVPTKPAFGSSQLERMEIPVASVYVIDSAGIPSGPLEIPLNQLRTMTRANTGYLQFVTGH